VVKKKDLEKQQNFIFSSMENGMGLGQSVNPT